MEKIQVAKYVFAGVFYGLFMQFLFINDPDIAKWQNIKNTKARI
jgi:hypothetical protein